MKASLDNRNCLHKKPSLVQGSKKAGYIPDLPLLKKNERCPHWIRYLTLNRLGQKRRDRLSDIKLFKISSGRANELTGRSSDLEKPLQTLMETNLNTLLGVRFLATEYSTGKTHSGRIDSLGLDENSCPVIIEYKRSISENVINQGLFYLDWLMDHQAEFKLLVMESLNKETANRIDWGSPRLICIASDFTKYDSHAVQQMNRNIELIRYKVFEKDLLLLELVNSAAGSTSPTRSSNRKGAADKLLAQALADTSPEIKELFDSLEAYLFSLGDDIQRKDLKLYVVFKRIKNFVCVVVQKKKILLLTSIDPDSIQQAHGFIRDVRGIGHWGTGDTEISLSNIDDLERAKPLLLKSYEGF
jgi:predicted transport protein